MKNLLESTKARKAIRFRRIARPEPKVLKLSGMMRKFSATGDEVPEADEAKQQAITEKILGIQN